MDELLRVPEIVALERLYGRDAVRVQARLLVDELRAGPWKDDEERRQRLSQLPRRLAMALEIRFAVATRRVLNATGVFLHTNLGRAPLPAEVIGELAPLLSAGCDLEMDLGRGERGDRSFRVGRLLAELTGAEAAIAVNNAAAALWLALAVAAAGREVIVSRGELVEIGGSFRIPEILSAAGARLVEVGTTNRTRLADYERAVGERTALLLKIFPSNYRIEGFVAAVGVEELAALGKRRRVPLLVDEGSGLLRPHPAPALRRHPAITELVRAGATLVTASGDKLLGGPQAGLLLGSREAVEECRRHPLYRALRPGRMTLVTLEAVLRHHLRGAALPLQGLWPDAETHRLRLAAFAAHLAAQAGLGERVEIAVSEAFVGGGSAPQEPIAGEAIAIRDAAGLAAALRGGSPAVLASERAGRLWLDLRTVAAEDDEALAMAVRGAFRRREEFRDRTSAVAAGE